MEATVNSAVLVNNTVSNVAVINDATDGFRVNRNREHWDAVYTEIRKLCVIKGEKIRKYAPEFSGNPRKSIQFVKGEVKINDEFWQTLKPAHKSQLRMIVNKIQTLYNELYDLQAKGIN